MTDARPGAPTPLRILFGLFKAVCIVFGLPLTIIGLMALTGKLSGNDWVRLLGGVVMGVVIPLLLIDRLLPADARRGRGMISNGLALIYVAVPLLFVITPGLASRALVREGDRLVSSGWSRTAGLAYWLGGVEAEGMDRKTAPVPRPDSGPAPDSRAGQPRPRAVAPDAGLHRDAAAAPADARALDSRPSKLTPSEIFQRCGGAVMFIKTERGGGTGFLIDDKGTIATNSHVIHEASAVEVKLKDGTFIREVELLVENEEADLALLAVRPDKLPAPLQLGDSDRVVVGEQAVAIGNPLGLEHTLTDGLISARRVYQGKRWLQISVPLSPGNSGGPLFNMLGEVIGVNTATVSIMAQNLNLAVPVDELKRMIKGSYPGRRSIGASAPGSW